MQKYNNYIYSCSYFLFWSYWKFVIISVEDSAVTSCCICLSWYFGILYFGTFPQTDFVFYDINILKKTILFSLSLIGCFICVCLLFPCGCISRPEHYVGDISFTDTETQCPSVPHWLYFWFLFLQQISNLWVDTV